MARRPYARDERSKREQKFKKKKHNRKKKKWKIVLFIWSISARLFFFLLLLLLFQLLSIYFPHKVMNPMNCSCFRIKLWVRWQLNDTQRAQKKHIYSIRGWENRGKNENRNGRNSIVHSNSNMHIAYTATSSYKIKMSFKNADF